jgi:hypothetical protein
MLIEKRDSANKEPPAMNIKAINFVFIGLITSLRLSLQRRGQSAPLRIPKDLAAISPVATVARKSRSGAFGPSRPRAGCRRSTDAEGKIEC